MAEPVEHGTSVLPGAIGSVWRSEGRQKGGGLIPLLTTSLRSKSIATTQNKMGTFLASD